MRLGLAFSGGKDSLACWYLSKHRNPVIFWINTGKAYPETVAIVNEIRGQCEDFIEVRSDQQGQIDENGLPSDIVPVNFTDFGMQIAGQNPVKVQSHLHCCYQNIAVPLLTACKAHGITHLIRGQRNDELNKATSRDGSVIDGVTFLHPIEFWTRTEVMDYLLVQRGSIPDHFDIEHSSLDCYDCTGFLAHSKDRVAWTKLHHPDLYGAYARSMAKLKAVCAGPIRELEMADG